MSEAEASPVLVSGATGLVGGRLLRRLRADGVSVRALSRDAERAARNSSAEGVEWRDWDGLRVPPEALRGAGAVVHLAGEPVFGGLPSARRRERVRASRVESTRALAEAVAALPAEQRPRSLVCASATGYYGDRGEQELDESAPPGSGFLARLCADWEAAAGAAQTSGVRVVSARIGVVLAREGGALRAMAIPFRLGVGGRLGSGRQWFSWIHADDLVSLLCFALREPRLSGPVNAVAPQPVRNAELTRALARVVRRPALLPVPAPALRALLGELAGELLGSRRVVPRAACAAGFRFAHPEIEEALRAELAGG
jgi:uncharacterized protein (TIGR01777 family)